MPRLALVLAAIVAGCGGGSTTVTPSSAGGGDNGGGGGMTPGGGGASGGGMPGGGGGGTGGTGGGAGTGGTGGGGTGGSGGGGSGGAGGGGGGAGGGGGTAIGPCSTTPQLLAHVENGLSGIAVDETNVYFESHDPPPPKMGTPAKIWSAPLAGGAATLLMTTDADAGEGLFAVNATAVFYAQTGALSRIDKATRAVTLLARNDYFASMVDARGFIYYGAGDGIQRVPEDGGAPSLMVSSGYASALAFDASHVYFPYSQTVRRAPADGGSATDVASVADVHDAAINDVVVDDTSVYFDTYGNVWRADKASGAKQLLYGDVLARKLTLDGSNLFWDGIAGNSSVVRRIHTDGSAVTTVVVANGAITGLAVRGDSVYFAQSGDNGVYRVCK